MTKFRFNSKFGWIATTVASVAIAGSVATASAHHGTYPPDPGNGNSGYTKDQCKNGGWKDFKNPDGSQMFKNQGQCVAYFTHGNHNPGNHGHGHGHGNQDHGRFFSQFWASVLSLWQNLFHWWGGFF